MAATVKMVQQRQQRRRVVAPAHSVEPVEVAQQRHTELGRLQELQAMHADALAWVAEIEQQIAETARICASASANTYHGRVTSSSTPRHNG